MDLVLLSIEVVYHNNWIELSIIMIGKPLLQIA